jgi:flagellar biosynthetic protein FliR
VLVTVEIGWIIGTLLVSVRLAALLAFSPLFSLTRLPILVGILVTLVFSAAINSIVQQYATLAIESIDALLIAVVREAAVGLLMAFGIHCAFGAFSLGGRILDLQMGFGVANLVNPSSNEQAPLLGMTLLVVGVCTFFLLNGQQWLARGFVQSFQWFPLGAPLQQISLAVVMRQFGLMFSLGFILVSPVVAILLLIDVGMAIASKTMPQMNIFMLSMPIKIGIGLAVLALSAPHLRHLFQVVFASIFNYWNALG